VETRELRTVPRQYVLFLGYAGIRHGTEFITPKWRNLEDCIDDESESVC
jgi:hypothetical protein